jgi:hypothetical protein
MPVPPNTLPKQQIPSSQQSFMLRDGKLEKVEKQSWIPWLWIVAAAALAHLWCLGSQFYMDDMTGIRDSELIRAGEFWTSRTLMWTRFCYVLEYKLFGMSPVGFHAVNWLLHTAVACALFGFGRDFLRGRAPAGVALFGALLFVVHPLASEIPNYTRTQDLAWVTLFSLLASWALLRFLLDGGYWKLLWVMLGIVGATLSKGPGLFHALMMVGAVGLAFATSAHWCLLRRKGGWLTASFLIGAGILWAAGALPNWEQATRMWGESRFIGHGYTLSRVFWEFSWRTVVPVSLCSDHHIAETLIPPGAKFWNIPDTGAIWAALGMLVLTLVSLILAWRKTTRLFGVCLFLFVATILFRVTYLIPEFMPEYRIYPGLPWICLGAAIALGTGWRKLFGAVSPLAPAVILLLLFTVMSARRSFVWHDLDRLTADVLKQYPAQARAIWELHDRDIQNEDWQRVINRQHTAWPEVFKNFLAENKRLAPERELPSGHFALADIACKARYAIALTHARGAAAGLMEIQKLEAYMKALRLGPETHRIHWSYFYKAKGRVLEDTGNYQAALDLMRREDIPYFKDSDIERLEKKLAEKKDGS